MSERDPEEIEKSGALYEEGSLHGLVVDEEEAVCVQQRIDDYERFLEMSDKGDTVYHGSSGQEDGLPILTFNPTEELHFSATDGTLDRLAPLSITNDSRRRVAYKLKTTCPHKFRVSSPTGIIPPQSTADVQLFLVSGYFDTVSKEKFQVIYMDVDPEVTESQVDRLFKVTSRDSYRHHRLYCRLAVPDSFPETMIPTVSSSDQEERLAQVAEQVHLLVAGHRRLESQLSGTHLPLLVVALLLLLLLLLLVLLVFPHGSSLLPASLYTINYCPLPLML